MFAVEERNVATDKAVRARIKARVKRQAAAVKVPNAETRAAMDELGSGKGKKARNAKELLSALNVDD